MNYYELFQLKESPFIDKSKISGKYIELQKQSHPDFYTQENEAAQDSAIERSAEINKAYKIFSDKDLTIEYFLKIKNVLKDDEKFSLPAEFLMEMMELNEGLSENEASEKEIKNFEKEIEDQLHNAINNKNEEDLTDANLQELKTYFYKKKYLKRILERLND